MRTLFFPLLISLLILIQSQGSSGDDGTVTILKTITTTIGEVGAILKTYENLDEAGDAVGKYNFRTKIIAKMMTHVGTHFAPIWGLATLVIGTPENKGNSQLLKKMESLSQDISNVYNKFESQTLELIDEMRQIQQENLLPRLKNAKENYENYIQKSDPDHYADFLIRDYLGGNVDYSVTALRDSIRKYTSTRMKSHGDCIRLTDQRVWLATLLSDVAFALGAGCVENAKKKRYNKTRTHEACDDLPSYKKIGEIEEIMIEEINKCTTSFAKDYTKKWLRVNIRTSNMDGTSKSISSMLTKTFPQFSHTVVVYPPLHGFSEHTTNFGVTLFRFREMNIVVSILYRRNKSCYDSDKDLGKYLTYKKETGLSGRGTTIVKSLNDDSAQDLYNKLKSYGNARLLVFKEKKYSINGDPDIWCEILYSDEHSKPTTIVWI